MIKTPPLFAFSVVLLLLGVGTVIERVLFLEKAERAVGTVTQVTARNTTCGSKQSRSSCTRFEAIVTFRDGEGRGRTFEVSAGREDGHGKPLSRASLHTGDDVAVVYDPENEWRTYRDTLAGVWWAPMLVWGGQIATFLGSLTEGLRERRTA